MDFVGPFLLLQLVAALHMILVEVVPIIKMEKTTPGPCVDIQIVITQRSHLPHFDVETDWDALYIHNGDDISAPIFSSGNGITQAGFPAGGYYGTTLPPTYTSSHASGCLTFAF